MTSRIRAHAPMPQPWADRLDLAHNVAVADALCVFCRERPADVRWRPFCSERCKLLDLARWVEGDYRVPGEPGEDPADDDEDDDR
jgi:endogenous inhibitor of DNA gyrase (YacG/DUF329 family)